MISAEKREYQRKWVAKRRYAFFSDKKCAFCSSSEELELHHLDPTQKEANAIWSWSKTRRDTEIAKCIILCAACHRVETNKQIGVLYEHGSWGSYNKRKCRCALCKEACRLQTVNRRERERNKFGPHFRKIKFALLA